MYELPSDPRAFSMASTAMAEELPTETVLTQARWIITFGGASANFAYAAIMMIALPLSLNYIITGDASTPTKTSQMVFTACFFVQELSSFLFAAALGEAGNVIGRKKTALLALIGYGASAVLSLLAHVASIVALHVLAQIALGATSPFMPTALAYLTDVSAASSTQKLERNLGAYMGLQFCGLLVGFIVALGTIVGMKPHAAVAVQYVVAAVSMFVASSLFCWGLPDISPARSSRRAFQWRSAVPYQPLLEMWSWSAYTRLIFLQMFLQYAGLAAFQAYFANYALKRFGMKAFAMVGLALFNFMWASTCSFAVFRCFKLKAAVKVSYAAVILSPISVIFAPSNSPIVLFIAAFLLGPGLCLSGGLQAMFFGQVSEKERGDLAGAAKACNSLGQMIGVPIGGAFGTIFMGSSEVQAAFPGFPCVSNLLLFALAVLAFVINEKRYQAQDRLSPPALSSVVHVSPTNKAGSDPDVDTINQNASVSPPTYPAMLGRQPGNDSSKAGELETSL